jgi:hypothetical protein
MVWTLVTYLVINLFLLGLGIGIGFLLRWILPAVDLGVGILTGVVVTIASVNLFLRINGITGQIENEELLHEIISGRALRVIEPKPIGRRRKRKAPDSESPRP